MEIDSGDTEPLASTFQSVLLDLPLIQSEYIIISKRKLNVSKEITVEDKNIESETEAMFAIDFDVTKRADVSLIQRASFPKFFLQRFHSRPPLKQKRIKENCLEMNHYVRM